eukprot:TRINITY_DN11788_c0_g2_i2.p1 TRINITY_DN11788_c0_g2~~TRINITY_DN11788_c0_g2_i2.p1  ORF type:complete len:165 (-),score=18.82 TRINITY_DN11788_c0_g2_i2:80-574(-)
MCIRDRNYLLLAQFLLAIDTIFLFLIVVMAEPSTSETTKLLLYIQMPLGAVLSVFQAIGIQSFYAKVADVRIGATYLALLNFFDLVGKEFAHEVSVLLIGHFGFQRASVAFWAIGGTFLIFYIPLLLHLGGISPYFFLLKDQTDTKRPPKSYFNDDDHFDDSNL